MKYCSFCRAELHYEIPDDDNRHRYVCRSCDIVHYQNPRVVTGCLPIWQDKVLLCKRAISPRHGYWTLPAGFMELGETSFEGALRETMEEANARVEIDRLFAVFNLPHVDQVYMMFQSRLMDLDFFPGVESQEVELFSESDIPWDKLAFSTIRHTLRLFFQDREAGSYKLHTGDVIKHDDTNYQFVPGPES